MLCCCIIVFILMSELFILEANSYYKLVVTKDIEDVLGQCMIYSPDVHLFGKCRYTKRLEEQWQGKFKSVATDIRGEWYKIEDSSLLAEMSGLFQAEGGQAIDEVEMRIGVIYREMLRCIELKSLFRDLSSCGGYKDRAIVYSRYMKRIGRDAFRFYQMAIESEKQNKMSGVYYFDGRIWCQLDEVEFGTALERLCLTNMGVSSGEWLSSEKMFVSKVRDGARLSVLNVSKSVVGFQNGVFDFGNMSNIIYHPFSDRMPIISLLEYDYTFKADCPMWDSFLSGILDKRQILILQKYFSLGLVDRATMSAKVENSLWLIGPGGAGKSTILDTITHVYGRESVSSAPLGDILSGNSISRPMILGSIVGKVFNCCAEAQASDITGKADTFKSLCSGEPQVVRRIGRDYETSYEIPYLVFSMNTKPRLGRIDSSISRRLLFVVFKSAIREIDRDPELREKLKKEAAGIRNWLIRGYEMLVSDGYKIENTERGSDESDSWLVENGQTVELFMRKNGCRAYSYTGQSEKPMWFPVKVLFDRYSKWCVKWGYEMDVDLNGMGRELRRIGFAAKRTAAGIVYQVYGGDNLK